MTGYNGRNEDANVFQRILQRKTSKMRIYNIKKGVRIIMGLTSDQEERMKGRI